MMQARIPERTGVVEDGQRRLAVYGRFIKQAAHETVQERLARLVTEAVERELKSVVEKVVTEQIGESHPAGDSTRVSRMIDECVELRVQAALEQLVAERLRQAVDKTNSIRHSSRPPLAEIVVHVAQVTGISPQDILGPRRAGHVAKARQLAYWLARRLRRDLSVLTIARTFGKDHTSVLDGARKVEDRKDLEPFHTWLAAPAIVALLNPAKEV